MATYAFGRGSTTGNQNGSTNVSFSYIAIMNVSDEVSASDFTFEDSFNPPPGNGSQLDVHFRYTPSQPNLPDYPIPAGNRVIFLTKTNSNLDGGVASYPEELKGMIYQMSGPSGTPVLHAIGSVSYQQELQGAASNNPIKLQAEAGKIGAVPNISYPVNTKVTLPHNSNYPDPTQWYPDVKVFFDDAGVPHLVIEYYYPHDIPEQFQEGDNHTYPLPQFTLNTNIELDFIEVVFVSETTSSDGQKKKKHVKGSAVPPKDDTR